MKIFEDQGKFIPFRSRAYQMYFGETAPTAFDLETLGLSSRRDPIILSGFLEEKNGAYHAVQFFAETPEQEEALIRETLSFLNTQSFLLTFNGRSFDIPFFTARAAKFGLRKEAEQAFRHIYHLDLYQIIRSYSPLADVLSSLSQKSVEQLLGIDHLRKDQIDGGESIREYESYLEKPTEKAESTILLHNHDDILQLARLLPILKKVRLHDAMRKLGFPKGPFIVQNIAVRQGVLEVRLSGKNGLKEYIAFPSADVPYHLISSASKNLAEVRFPLEKFKPGVQILDAEGILGSENIPGEFVHFPGFRSGYLIIRKEDTSLSLELNAFVLAFLQKINWLSEAV